MKVVYKKTILDKIEEKCIDAGRRKKPIEYIVLTEREYCEAVDLLIPNAYYWNFNSINKREPLSYRGLTLIHESKDPQSNQTF